MYANQLTETNQEVLRERLMTVLQDTSEVEIAMTSKLSDLSDLVETKDLN